MRPQHEPLWQFETARFVVAFFAEEEDLDPNDCFSDLLDVEFARSGIPAAWFSALVVVYAKGGSHAHDVRNYTPIGWDHLGGCSYDSFEDFYQGHLTNGRGLGGRGYFGDMVRQAIADARRNAGNLKGLRATTINFVGV